MIHIGKTLRDHEVILGITGIFDHNFKMPIKLILHKKVWHYSPLISLNFDLNCKECQNKLDRLRQVTYFRKLEVL